jgi:hypothetical protein
MCPLYINTDIELQLIMSLNKIYMRTESERYNSRWKKLNNERAYVRNINQTYTIGHICLLTTAIAAIKSKKPIGLALRSILSPHIMSILYKLKTYI